VLAKLKKEGHYSNYQRRTLGEFVRDVRRDGLGAAVDDRLMWGRMRMAPADIADVSGHHYTYLMNGHGPDTGWYGLFTPGERVRLRFINAAAMSYFNVRIPGLPMTIVQADGQDVAPVTVDEFQMAVAETFDVVVEPQEGRAFTVFAESMDRSGFARGTLAPREGMTAAVPVLREPPRRTMVDMGMEMEDGHDMPTPMDHTAMGHDMAGMDMAGTAEAGLVVARHGPDTHGAGNAGVARVQRNRLGEPGTGLDGVEHRVLVYRDLRALQPRSQRPPDREIELHVTGNMERYMWSFDGVRFSEVRAPIPFARGERLRLTLVNDTMMEHPIHLHGMWMELENGQGEFLPRKHTISVKPAERLSVLITADAPGRWAFHCHLLYHMDMGMFRVVEVSPYEGEL
jgi:CopA family copper-resistance protein